MDGGSVDVAGAFIDPVIHGHKKTRGHPRVLYFSIADII